jgi:altronate dehydratase small subunit
MNKKAILMNENDSVAIALSELNKNDTISIIYKNKTFTELSAFENIEIYHKIAVKPIKKGDIIYKYGEVIGAATAPIEIGEHVHIHNIESVAVGNED